MSAPRTVSTRWNRLLIVPHRVTPLRRQAEWRRMPEVLLLVPFAYLLGTLPSARMVARRRGLDIHHTGSGNPGAWYVFRVMGWKWGRLVLVLDIGKGALAAGVGAIVDGPFDGHRGAYVLG